MKNLPSLLALFALSFFTYAQDITLTSYQRAREVVDRAARAYGGVDHLRAIENFSLRASGDTVQRNQSRKTFASDRTPYSIEVAVDLKNERFYQVVDGGYPGGFHYNSGFAVVRADGIGWDLIRKNTTARPNVPAAAGRQRLRYLPQFFIVDSLRRASRLRWMGAAAFDGRPHTVVSYANDDALETSLYFDDKTHLLSKVEWLGTDPFTGDTVTELIFPGYRTSGGDPMPTGRLTRVGGELNEDLKYDELKFNAQLADDKFKAPAGFTAAAPAPQAVPLVKLSDTAYTFTAGGYNVLFVGFKDHVFVMETPGGDSVSRQAIEKIKSLFPGKPIRYAAVTHHHDDHAGGIRTYVAEGATIISTPGEKAFFEKVMASKFTISPDALATKPQPLKWEGVTGKKRVFTDGVTTLELYDIGPGPHTDEMLVAYLPNEKVVFQGDLLNRPGNGDAPIANDTTAHFAKWLADSRLAVERIAAVHGGISTVAELRQAVVDLERSKAAAKK